MITQTFGISVVIMNSIHDSENDIGQSLNHDIGSRFIRHNAKKYLDFLQHQAADLRKQIKSLPLFFHVNQNLFPGYINNKIPCSIFNYLPEEDVINHARTFNSAFEYNPENIPSLHAIDAVYLQDNAKSGRLILWIIPHKDLDTESINLLRLKADAINKWREARRLKLVCYIASPQNMSSVYWNNQFDSIRPDKSIFLDEFYSESILLAGKPPAWWFVPPDLESEYDPIMEELEKEYPNIYDSMIDFGSITNTRLQDYLAYSLLNLANIRQCPPQSWLNTLELCKKLSVYPEIDQESKRLKKYMLMDTEHHVTHMHLYCDMINETIDTIYGRSSNILIDRALGIVSAYQATAQKPVNLYKFILDSRCISIRSSRSNQEYELTIATDIIYDLTRRAFIWFTNKLNMLDNSIIKTGSDLDTAINSLLHNLDPQNSVIPVTNINYLNTSLDYDVRINNNTETHPNNWTLTLHTSSGYVHEAKRANNAIELTIWGVLNRIIHPNTRISVNCPYLSVKQVVLANIANIVANQLTLTTDFGWSFSDHLAPEIPIKDILIIHQETTRIQDITQPINVYRMQFTNHGQCKYSQHQNLIGILDVVCDAISSDLALGRRAHEVEIHALNSGTSSTLAHDTKLLQKEITDFAYKSRKDVTHFIFQINGRYYGISRIHNRLTPHLDLNCLTPEDSLPVKDVMRISYSESIDNHKLLNYLYNQNAYGVLQLFFQTADTIAHVYILDENGCLIRFSQPFYDRQAFIHQWMMFIYNIRNHIKSQNYQTCLPNMDVYEINYSERGYLNKTLITSSSIPADNVYYDVQLRIQGEVGKQVIVFKCENREFSSAQYGTNIYTALQQYLASNLQTSTTCPVYISDVDIPSTKTQAGNIKQTHIRDYIRYKINIEKRLNSGINKS